MPLPDWKELCEQEPERGVGADGQPYTPYYYNMKPLEEPGDFRVTTALNWLRWHTYEATLLFFAALILALILVS